jgi:plastocyanin
MKNRKLLAGVIGLCLAIGVSGVSMAASSAPKKNTITEKGGATIKPNRYIQDELRFAKDVYNIKSGGAITFINTVADEGPHTVTIVKKKDLPRKSPACPICEKLGQAHGADPNSDAPPKFQFLENGVGTDQIPSVDRPGDSVLSGAGQKGEKVTFNVTAKKGTTLYFMCIIHPWMQGKIQVG